MRASLASLLIIFCKSKTYSWCIVKCFAPLTLPAFAVRLSNLYTAIPLAAIAHAKSLYGLLGPMLASLSVGPLPPKIINSGKGPAPLGILNMPSLTMPLVGTGSFTS